MLERHINVRADFLIRGDGSKQPRCDLVGIRIEKANPAQLRDAGKFFQQQREAIFQAKVLTVAGSVLADESNFAHARAGQALGLRNYRLKPARTELPAQLRNNAKTARMVAAFGNLDVGSVSRRRK